ncbi:MAG: low-specificity L-threonine aldolase [Candidatus Zipacnadales bacterium]
MIDLRSDTVTKPTPEMREAMARAEVGDDVWGEDPTVRALEERCATIMGMEAGLFVASGTMGNQVALFAHTQRGDEVIVERHAHIGLYEAGAFAVISGLVLNKLEGRPWGVLDPNEVREAIAPNDIHRPPTRLVCLENTHNMSSGTVITAEQTRAIADVAHAHGLLLHIDGARIFNAATYLGVEPKVLAEPADSIQFCFSKGLAAPVGSMVCGTREFIAKARRARKMMGGGMRQAGVLAAACHVSLDRIVPRLHEDHANARLIAEELARHEGVSIDLNAIQTNIIRFEIAQEVMEGARLAALLRERGILVDARGGQKFRLVTHNDVSAKDAATVAAAFAEILG